MICIFSSSLQMSSFILACLTLTFYTQVIYVMYVGWFDGKRVEWKLGKTKTKYVDVEVLFAINKHWKIAALIYCLKGRSVVRFFHNMKLSYMIIWFPVLTDDSIFVDLAVRNKCQAITTRVGDLSFFCVHRGMQSALKLRIMKA